MRRRPAPHRARMEGSAGASDATADTSGFAGCAGAISYAISGNAVSITTPTGSATAGGAVSIPFTYSAASPYSSFAITGWTVSCTSGGSLTASGSTIGASQSGTITGTAPTTAGSTSCTITATSQDSNSGTNGYQNSVTFTLTVSPAAANKIAFTPASPGPGSVGTASRTLRSPSRTSTETSRLR